MGELSVRPTFASRFSLLRSRKNPVSDGFPSGHIFVFQVPPHGLVAPNPYHFKIRVQIHLVEIGGVFNHADALQGRVPELLSGTQINSHDAPTTGAMRKPRIVEPIFLDAKD